MAEIGKKLKVVAVGNLCASDICGEKCENCPRNESGIQATLLEGVTRSSVELLFDEVELLPVGTLAKLEELEKKLAEIV
jgi:hypothetical protein